MYTYNNIIRIIETMRKREKNTSFLFYQDYMFSFSISQDIDL